MTKYITLRNDLHGTKVILRVTNRDGSRRRIAYQVPGKGELGLGTREEMLQFAVQAAYEQMEQRRKG